MTKFEDKMNEMENAKNLPRLEDVRVLAGLVAEMYETIERLSVEVGECRKLCDTHQHAQNAAVGDAKKKVSLPAPEVEFGTNL